MSKSKIKPIRPVAVGIVNVQDVLQTLDGLSGNYAARDLYERYCSVAVAQDRTPASINGFSRELTRLGLSRFVSNNKSVWIVRQTALLDGLKAELK